MLLIRNARDLGALTAEQSALVVEHQIEPTGEIRSYFDEIAQYAGEQLILLARRGPTRSLSRAIDLIVQWRTTIQCQRSFVVDGYFRDAEAVMSEQWRKVIWPIIEGSDFSSILELAPGHGRNTERLLPLAGSIDLVDINQSCIDACKGRFGHNPKIRYHVTDGNHFRMIPDNSITFGYSWDSMVHFDKLVVRDYLFEFARVLKPGATAFLHASNYGSFKPNSSWTTNHGNRSDLSRDIFNAYAAEAGLTVKSQRLSGRADGWGMDDLDCLTLLTSQ
ncbi:MAG: methylase involved in ubiquinone/menaquinone biosynthesis [Bradyrhizobium sp.]|nr:methylase involved in ubiquinone/menaquinone biosynthesis [Bradyrhizobium sp.]